MESLEVWNGTLKAAMNLPLVKVDRESFLRENLRNYCPAEKLEGAISDPVTALGKETINKIAEGCVSSHTLKVTATSALAGFPGGLAMIGTVPADVVQYYGHVLCLSQKLAYLYGYPSILTEDGKVDDGTIAMLTLFVGVAIGNVAATQALQKLSKELAIQVAIRLPKEALTKYALYGVAKKVGKWVGISVTKASAGRTVSKVIPFIGAVFSGGLTYAMFKPMANKMRKHFENTAILRISHQ